MDGDVAGNEQRQAVRLEEIVVTATRRSENLQDVPIAISALSTFELERQGIENFEDFARQIPGVSFNRTTKNASTFTFRGISINTLPGGGLQNSTAVYLGDVPVSTTSAFTPDVRLFDIERVEILRGPQGTLFGSGSLAGTVRILPNEPQFNEFDAKLRVDGGLTKSDSIRQRYDGMVNIPLVDDSLAMRAVGYFRDEDGWIDNLGTGEDNANGSRDWGARGSLRWAPTDRFSAKLMVMHDVGEPGDLDFIDPQLGEDKVDTIIPGEIRTEITNYNVSFEYDFEWATLQSSTNYSDFEVKFDQDFNGILTGVFPGFIIATRTSAPALVQETKLISQSDSRLQWTVGAFYMDRELDVEALRSTDPNFLVGLHITGLDEGLFYYVPTELEERETAGFGELSWDISNDLTATVGVRYSHFRRKLTQLPGAFNQTGAVAGAVLAGGSTEIPEPTLSTGNVIGPDTFSEVTTKFALSWRPADSMTYYFTAAEGFRNALPNANAGLESQIDPNDIVIPDVADADKLWNYELGLKADWFDGMLRTNMAAYYIVWEDIQLLAVRPSDGTRFFANAGDAESMGLEVEVLARPSDNLELGLNLTLQEAEIDSITDQQAAFSGATEGSELTAPDFKMSGFVQYTWMLEDRGSLYLRADVQHVGSYPNTQPNTVGQPDTPSPVFQQLEAYENVNASLGWITDKWTLVLYGENLLDNDDLVFRQPDTAVIGNFGTLRPRTLGFRATWRL
ncbi:TonB-dependent receptor [Kineobactrum salinum]|uniref:TonB-dependent receptor n=1 Tax=Kineobactrum salinum TaxID=2708301 RepID=A0A6C0U998_9GAMM|nr:TonB-dependent receptor [Kineobactrum salinum]QIB67195.1 TonB-dependent receptor [Kineobactrum salinum]